MSDDQSIIEKLDELIAATKAVASREWLDIHQLADYIGYSVEHTRQRIVTLHEFPVPSRPNGGHPRWQRSEVRAWMESQTKR